MRFSFIAIIILFFCGACKKEKKQSYTIKGRYVDACTGNPIANEVFIIYQSGSNGGMYGNSLEGVYMKTYSNANGEFEINYETNHSASLKINNSSLEIPVEDLDLGNIPYSLTSQVFYKLKVINTHANIDTLRFGLREDSNTSVYFMNGPFHDTIIGLRNVTTVLYAFGGFKYDAISKKITLVDSTITSNACYVINANSSAIPQSSNQEKVIKPCNLIADTVELVVY